jgi:hypothetical protein
VAIVSGAHASTLAGEVRQAGFSSPVLVDVGDALYGRLGVLLHPSVRIADKNHKLVADVPFAKTDFRDVIVARHATCWESSPPSGASSSSSTALTPGPLPEGNNGWGVGHQRFASAPAAGGRSRAAGENG